MSQQDNSKFYQKAFLAGKISFALREKEYSEMWDGDAVLPRLHDFLATISVAQARGEVIACHIALGSGSSKLYMSRNDAWTDDQRKHVEGVRELLADMVKEKSTPSEVNKLKIKLKDSIFGYCKKKMQKRIGMLLKKVNQLERLKEPCAVVEVIKADLEKLKKFLEDPKNSGFVEKSEKCREVAQDWKSNTWLVMVREKFPVLEKRLLRVAAYISSVDELSEWATGTGDYSQYHESYPIPDETLFYSATPSTSNEPIGQGSWKTIAKTLYPNEATDKNITCLKDCKDSRTRNPQSPKDVYLHAEMHIVEKLLDDKKELDDQVQQEASSTSQPRIMYIGISKLCCYLCYRCINTVNSKFATSGGLHIIVKGTHNKVYSTWLIPPFFSDQLFSDQLPTLEEKLDALNSEALKHPNKHTKEEERDLDES